MTFLWWLVVAVCAANLALTLPVLVLGEARHRATGWVDDLGWVGLDVLLNALAVGLIVTGHGYAIWAPLLIDVCTRRRYMAAFHRVRASAFPGQHAPTSKPADQTDEPAEREKDEAIR